MTQLTLFDITPDKWHTQTIYCAWLDGWHGLGIVVWCNNQVYCFIANQRQGTK